MASSSQVVGMLNAPYLESFYEAAWFTFVRDFRAFKAKGGKAKFYALISSTALTIIARRLQVIGKELPQAQQSSDDDKITPRRIVHSWKKFMRTEIALCDFCMFILGVSGLQPINIYRDMYVILPILIVEYLLIATFDLFTTTPRDLEVTQLEVLETPSWTML